MRGSGGSGRPPRKSQDHDRRYVMSSTLIRIISALAVLPFVLWLMYIGGLPFFAMILVASAICLFELMNMVNPAERGLQILLTALGLALVAAVGFGVMATPAAIVIIAFLPIVVVTIFLFKLGDMNTVAARAGLSVLGILWGAGLFSCLCLRLLDRGGSWVFLACILAWGSDTGAYFAGRLFGRRKLYPAVSPNKTWEGAVGGVIVATALAFGQHVFCGAPPIDPVHLAILAPLGAAFGQVGDLAESLLKRSVGVKDSGRIMPGHGGLFDRVDALIFTGSAVLAYAVLVERGTLYWMSI